MFDEYGTDQPAGGLILHYVQITDTLGSLAMHYYGSGEPHYVAMILDHNTHYIVDPNNLTPGIKLAIPYHPHLRARVAKLTQPC